MLSQLGIEGRLVQYLVALFIVLALVGLFALVLRRITGGRMGLSTGDRGRTRQPRLGIVDVYDLDRQRQLVLLRRDNVEHLLLIGGPNDVVVETNIMRVAAGRQPQAGQELNGAPQPQAVPERMPTAALEAYAPSPERVPQERLQPDRPANDGPPRPILEPSVGARMNLPEPQPLAPVAGDPMNDLANRVRTLRPEPPMVADAALSYEVMPQPPAPPALRSGATIATPRAPDPRLVEPRPPQPQAAPSEGDAEVMSDMARQLEQALRRPAPPAAAPSQVQPPAAPARMAPQAAPRPPEPPRQAPPAPRPVAPPEPPAPAPRAAPPPPAPRPAEPTRQPAGSGKVDPFSVDEIEAEFARLLGRSPDKT